MRILGLDTSTLTAGIAIIDDARQGDQVVARAHHDSSSRSADLLVTIDRVFREAGLEPTQLDAIAVGGGPGSFTGLRIGMATAKGIAFAANRPLWIVSSLAALARDAAAPPATVVAAALDARRGEVFAGCYCDGALLGSEGALAPADLASWAAELARERPGTTELRFAGNALLAYPDVLSPLTARWLPAITPSGTSVAQLALAGPKVDALAGGAPTYIRASEAEVKYPDGVPGALRRR
jgi:tRNA threonylcarbamoyladenosine biosynthesis protein TsaB